MERNPVAGNESRRISGDSGREISEIAAIRNDVRAALWQNAARNQTQIHWGRSSDCIKRTVERDHEFMATTNEIHGAGRYRETDARPWCLHNVCVRHRPLRRSTCFGCALALGW